jgi:AcrR family transcriptional regulator
VARSRTAQRNDADSATRTRVVDAAVSAIVELGYYRASSNEIARRAGVSWGVIQHYFGTRERLLLAVFELGQRELAQLAETGTIDSSTLEGRLEQLLDILALHYGTPSFLAYLQIQLNLGHDPDTSAEVRAIVDEIAVATISDVARLIRATLGPECSSDLAHTIFIAFRGFAISELLARTQPHAALPVGHDDELRRRRLLTHWLVDSIEDGVVRLL